MASAAPRISLPNIRTEPLRGGTLVAAGAIVWVAGALYCSGYEKLLKGVDNWPGSLVWSAFAVLPWLALFEWSKTSAGRRLADSAVPLAMLVVATALFSVSVELAWDWLAGRSSRPVELLLLRRLPATGACAILLLWSRTDAASRKRAAEQRLGEIASSIDWIEAADNYVELHIGGRVSMRRMPLRDAEGELSPHGFVRIHRRYLVNAERIGSVELNGPAVVRLKSGEELPVGRAYAANLGGAA